MWKRMECIAIYSAHIESSIAFYEAMGLEKAWDVYQDDEERWKLVGMRFPQGNTELVLKNNPHLQMADIEIVVENVWAVYEALRPRSDVRWIRTPFPNPLGGHVAVMQAPDGHVFVLVGA
ncbi:VOC family protein [Ectobacillus antri]|uniref:VOC family protein n=1 Tax=Ectobacillus antri TaxID=2486280 RepID=A0ABT6H7P8_9BACI|nr:VOC family protein [Ectobacillus antri]MDG4658191.1 VOC family protein [Ectobacillus antri]MDG5755289.1 VOC family protein [Ectobacillus antri]